MISRRDILKSVALSSVVLASTQALPADAHPRRRRPHHRGHPRHPRTPKPLPYLPAQSETLQIDFAEQTAAGLPKYLVVSNPTPRPLRRMNVRFNVRQLDPAGLLGDLTPATPSLARRAGNESGMGVWNFQLPADVAANSSAVFELGWSTSGLVGSGLRVLATGHINTTPAHYYEIVTQEFVTGTPFAPTLSAHPDAPESSEPSADPSAEPSEPSAEPSEPSAEPAPEPAPAPGPKPDLPYTTPNFWGGWKKLFPWA